MSQQWMIYGATGFTGRLIVEEAVRCNLKPVLAGRSSEAIFELSRAHALEGRVFRLDRPELIGEALRGISVVLNCAGPFASTAKPLMEACLKAQCHYLDITGELFVFVLAYRMHQEFKDRGISAMPGVGFDVAPTDFLANALHQRAPSADHLQLCILPSGTRLSQGTLKTMVEHMGSGTFALRRGLLEPVPQEWKTFEIGGKSHRCVAFSGADLASAHRSTGIGNIDTFLRLGGAAARQPWMLKVTANLTRIPLLRRAVQGVISWQPSGPDPKARAANHMKVFGRVLLQDRVAAAATLTMPDPYDVTVQVALHAVMGALQGKIPPGAHTPAQVFQQELLTLIEGNLEWHGKTSAGALNTSAPETTMD